MITICLGRSGDLMVTLGFLHHEYVESGVKPKLMVAEEYGDLLDGVNYVEPIIFNGPWNELGRAYKEALKLDKKVRLAQVAGPKPVLDKIVYGGKFDVQTESFEKEMWRVAGKLGVWPQNLPLVFDNRDKKREKELWEKVSSDWHWKKKEQPLVLVSTSGFSSPFPYTELLWELLGTRMRGYNVVDISELRAERIYDLIGLYEKAHCLILTDSAPLHLAQAVNVPVCALIADTPTLWHGSAWRPNHISYIRYKNLPRDFNIMFNAIENIGKPESAFAK